MGRIFTIRFLFRDTPYDALIAVKQSALKTEYHVRLLDEQLEEAFPGNKILQQMDDEINYILAEESKIAMDLMYVINQAIDEFLNGKNT